MEFKREFALHQLIKSKGNHLIKIVTGLRRVGKSYLLFTLFKRHLLESGVAASHIIEIQFDDFAFKDFRKADVLYQDIVNRTKDDNGMYYILLDEVQMLDDFVDVLNGFLHKPNLDVYVTGSNAKFLSSDIVTEFRGRGTQIHLYPLSFKELMEARSGDVMSGWREYMQYGGIPMVVLEQDEKQKVAILNSLIQETYLTDIIHRNHVKNDAELAELFNLLASSIGGLTNPRKISNTFLSVKNVDIASQTIKLYIDYFIDSFLISRAVRYDIKGKKYIDTPSKYYFADMGLRNALINFRQVEPSHIMENIIYNQLLMDGQSVDVGTVEQYKKDENGKTVRSIYEVDFVCNRAGERIYIQSAYSLPDEEKLEQEQKSLTLTKDSFPKFIITADNIPSYQLDNGIKVMNVYDYLLK